MKRAALRVRTLPDRHPTRAALPERWRVVSDHVGSTWRAWKLVPADEVEEYDNTDSDVWADDMDDEEL